MVSYRVHVLGPENKVQHPLKVSGVEGREEEKRMGKLHKSENLLREIGDDETCHSLMSMEEQQNTLPLRSFT